MTQKLTLVPSSLALDENPNWPLSSFSFWLTGNLQRSKTHSEWIISREKNFQLKATHVSRKKFLIFHGKREIFTLSTKNSRSIATQADDDERERGKNPRNLINLHHQRKYWHSSTWSWKNLSEKDRIFPLLQWRVKSFEHLHELCFGVVCCAGLYSHMAERRKMRECRKKNSCFSSSSRIYVEFEGLILMRRKEISQKCRHSASDKKLLLMMTAVATSDHFWGRFVYSQHIEWDPCRPAKRQKRMKKAKIDERNEKRVYQL